MKFYFKVLLIFIYVIKSIDIYIERLSDLGVSIGSVIYIVLFIMLIFGIISASLIKNNIYRYLFGILLFISAVFFDSYEKISSDFLTYNTFITLLNAQGFLDEAFKQYYYSILSSLVSGLLLLLGIVLKPAYPKILFNIPSLYFKLIPVFAYVALTALLFLRGGDGAKGLPYAFTPLAYSSLALYESMYLQLGDRKKISITRNNKKIVHDIVLVIDESISGDYIDINSNIGITTGLNETYKNIKIFNYGYAASITNCSSATNETIRYGGTRDNYLIINATMPSIWEYAKNANLYTVYIDSQRTGGGLQNKMSVEELKHIDKFIQFDDTPVVDRDIKAAKILVEMINNNKQEFIIINKIGAHFPIHDKYPDSFMKFKPALPRGNFLNVSDTGNWSGFKGSSSEWIEYRNSYKNTLLWNVGEFFSLIFKGANLDNAIIVYTSDHGQNLHTDGSHGLYTHCTSHPKQDEGIVPLVIIEGLNLNTLNWQQNLNFNKNKSSHYNIFPTLLTLMSYNFKEVKSIYGNSLNIKTNDAFTFNTMFYARLGRKPTWKKIEIKKILNAKTN
jgi:glucan phosphoethanolaminetransferase (alkaline phosphatase superfamily)